MIGYLVLTLNNISAEKYENFEKYQGGWVCLKDSDGDSYFKGIWFLILFIEININIYIYFILFKNFLTYWI